MRQVCPRVELLTCWHVYNCRRGALVLKLNLTNKYINSQHYIERKITLIMGRDCCGQKPLSPELAVPIAASTETMNTCLDSCWDVNDAQTIDAQALGQEERSQEKLDDSCSFTNCANDKTEHNILAPDCCRGKVTPCCDTSCIDRLAMRECQLNYMAKPGRSAQTNRQ